MFFAIFVVDVAGAVTAVVFLPAFVVAVMLLLFLLLSYYYCCCCFIIVNVVVAEAESARFN